MGETTIAWTDYTFNPWWGCVRVSPGCEHCYAEAFSHRLGLKLWGPTAGRRFFEAKHWAEPLLWAKRSDKGDPRRRVFCASMADVFERHQLSPDNALLDHERAKLWKLIEATPQLTWQLLTKRPENVLAMVPQRWLRVGGFPPNIVMLTTCEDQARYDLRMPHLVPIPARLKGISYEPALGPIDFKRHRGQLDWIIFGGESGEHARPSHPGWAATARAACETVGAAFFFKQTGSWTWKGWPGCPPIREERRWGTMTPEGEFFESTTPWNGHYGNTRYDEALCVFKGGRDHGEDPAGWPPEFNVRRFPQ